MKKGLSMVGICVFAGLCLAAPLKAEALNPNYSFMSCRSGLQAYQGYVTRVWYGRAWGIRNRLTYQRACTIALNACLKFTRYYYAPGSNCVVLGKKDLKDEGDVSPESMEQDK